MKNKFCWVELTTDDVDKAKRFYQAVFDWGFEAYDGAGTNYQMIDTGDGPQGGIMEKPDDNTPVCWSNYVGVEDHAPYLKKVEENGGKVLMPETEIPNTGSFSLVMDPGGAVLGLWKSNETCESD